MESGGIDTLRIRARALLLVAVGLLVGIVAVPVLAVTEASPHVYSGDGTTTDAYGGASLVWNGTATYAPGHTTNAGDQAFSVSPTRTLSVPNTTVGNLGTSDFTFHLWVRITGDGVGRQEILSKRPNCVAGESFLDVRAGSTFPGVEVAMQDPSNSQFRLVNPVDIVDGAWHELTLLRAGKDLYINVDGTTVTKTADFVINLDTDQPLLINDGGCVGNDTTTRSTALVDDFSFGPGRAVVRAPASPVPSPTATATTSSAGVPVVVPTTRRGTTPARSPSPGVTSAPPTEATTGTPSPTPTRSPTRSPSRSAPRKSSAVPSSTSASSAVALPAAPLTPSALPGTISGLPSSPPPVPVAVAFVRQVPDPGGAFSDPVKIVQDTVVGLLLLAFLALPVSIINNTAEVHVDELSARLAGVRRRLRVPSIAAWTTRLPPVAKLASTALLAGVLYAFLEPGVGFDLSSLALVLGLAIGLGALSAVYLLVQLRVLSRQYGHRGTLRVYPGFALIALLCVVLSRLIGLQPGLLLGTLVGAASAYDGPRREEGPALSVAYLGVFGVSVVGFLTQSLIDGTGFAASLLGVALSTLFLGGIGSVLFDLMPLSFLDGRIIFEWSKWAWAALWVVSGFGFVHLIVRPEAEDRTFAQHVGYLSVVLGIYLVAAFGFWAWFRRRRVSETADVTTAEPVAPVVPPVLSQATKKVPAKKVPAKKVPAKKVPAKKVPAKKAPVPRKTPRSS